MDRCYGEDRIKSAGKKEEKAGTKGKQNFPGYSPVREKTPFQPVVQRIEPGKILIKDKNQQLASLKEVIDAMASDENIGWDDRCESMIMEFLEAGKEFNSLEDLMLTLAGRLHGSYLEELRIREEDFYTRKVLDMASLYPKMGEALANLSVSIEYDEAYGGSDTRERGVVLRKAKTLKYIDLLRNKTLLINYLSSVPHQTKDPYCRLFEVYMDDGPHVLLENRGESIADFVLEMLLRQNQGKVLHIVQNTAGSLTEKEKLQIIGGNLGGIRQQDFEADTEEIKGIEKKLAKEPTPDESVMREELTWAESAMRKELYKRDYLSIVQAAGLRGREIKVEDLCAINKNIQTNGLNEEDPKHAGRFRQNPIALGGKIRLLESQDVVQEVEQFIVRYNKCLRIIVSLKNWQDIRNIHWLFERAAVLHTDFIYIHPFSNANGRVCRALIYNLFLAAGLPMLNIDPSSEGYKFYSGEPLYNKVYKPGEDNSENTAALRKYMIDRYLDQIDDTRAVRAALVRKSAGSGSPL